jgi:hypothetical protein
MTARFACSQKTRRQAYFHDRPRGPSQKYWRGLSGPRHPWLRRKCSMQAPTATALFSLPDGADDSETPSPYFDDRPLESAPFTQET